MGKLLGVNTNLILLEKWPMSSFFLGMASFALFRRLFVQLQRSRHNEIASNRCCVFLIAIRQGLKERCNKLLAVRCSKLFSVKGYAQMRECFEGVKTFSFHF